MTRLLVTGASGMLGANLALLAQDLGYEVLGWTNSRPLVSAPFATRAWISAISKRWRRLSKPPSQTR